MSDDDFHARVGERSLLGCWLLVAFLIVLFVLGAIWLGVQAW